MFDSPGQKIAVNHRTPLPKRPKPLTHKHCQITLTQTVWVDRAKEKVTEKKSTATGDHSILGQTERLVEKNLY